MRRTSIYLLRWQGPSRSSENPPLRRVFSSSGRHRSAAWGPNVRSVSDSDARCTPFRPTSEGSVSPKRLSTIPPDTQEAPNGDREDQQMSATDFASSLEGLVEVREDEPLLAEELRVEAIEL